MCTLSVTDVKVTGFACSAVLQKYICGGHEFKSFFVLLQLDMQAISSMSHVDLAEFLSAVGDRVAVFKFCMSHVQTGGGEAVGQKKQNLLAVVRTKLNEQSMRKKRKGSLSQTKANDCEDNVMFDKHTAVNRSTRIVELGWMHNNMQIRARNGGGTRDVAVCKSATKQKLIYHAKSLFWPDGQSYYGKAEHFQFELLDFKLNVMDDAVTVGELYDASHLRRMRFYLKSCDVDKLAGEVTDDDSYLPDASFVRRVSTLFLLTVDANAVMRNSNSLIL